MSSNDKRLGSIPMPSSHHPVSILTAGSPSVSSGVEIQNLVLDLIDESDRFRLRAPPYPGVAELAASIRENGQSTPLFVRRLPDGRYELISGYRRRAALASINAPTALCRVYTLDDRAAFELALSENQDREALTDIERADACARLQRDGYLTAQIAHHMGWESDRQVYNYLRIAKESSPALRLALQKRLFPLTVAMQLIKAFGELELDPATQDRAIQATVEGELSGKRLDVYLRRLAAPIQQVGASTEAVEGGYIRHFKNGAFLISARFDPKEPAKFDEVIEALKSALEQAKKIKKRHERESESVGDRTDSEENANP